MSAKQSEKRCPSVRRERIALAVVTFLLLVLLVAILVHRSRSWGVFGGGCFEVFETGSKGCRPSYTGDTRLTLTVR